MGPILTANNATYIRRINPVYFADFGLRDTPVGQMPYLKNLIVGKFGKRLFHSLAVMPSAMSCFIKHVLTMGAPDEVSKKAIGGVSVKVPTFHARGARPDEYFKDESIRGAVKMSLVFSQGHRRTTSRKTWAKNSMRKWLQNIFCASNFSSYGTPYNLFMPIRPYAALIGNIISGKVGNWFPNFFGGVKILARHLSALLNRVFLGSEPYPCENRDAACLFIAT